MKRLLELEATDHLTARAQVLVRAIGPTVPSELKLERVRRALDRPKSKTWRRFALPLVLAGGLVCASAAATTGIMLQISHGTPAASPSAGARPSEVPRVARVAKPDRPVPLVASPLPKPSEAPPANLVVRGPAPTSDVARVHEAAKALRHDGDPERALQLLERSGKPVTGPLAEEALALRIEAALAAGNGRQGKLGALYLKQYPNGRYGDLARRAVAERAP